MAAAAVLNIGVQSSKLTDRLSKREAIAAPLSIAALRGVKEFHNLERTLESMLGDAYSIEHEGLRRYLQNRSALYAEELVGRYEIIAEGYEGVTLPAFEIVVKTIGAEGLEGRIYAIRRE
jgi:hypothetical protein